MKKLLILFALTLAFRCFVFSQKVEPNIFITPGITIGYTWSAGWNYGINIFTGFFKINSNEPQISGGISFSYYFVNFESQQHIFTTFDAGVYSDYFRILVGAGKVKRNWGLNRRNQTKAYGKHVDFTLSVKDYRIPCFAIKSFIPQTNAWEWFSKPYYLSVYTYFRTEPFIPYKNN